MRAWIVLAVLVAGGPAFADDPWWDPKWPYRVKISVANPGNEALVGFPVPLRLGPDTPGWERLRKTALRFVAADGKTVLPHDVPWWDPERGEEVHVRLARIPPLGADCWFWMYFGSGKPGPGSEPAQVWSAGYVAVYHLAQTEGPYVDSLGRYHSLGVRVGSRRNDLGPGGRPVPFFNGKQEDNEHIDLGRWNVEGEQMSLEAFFLTHEHADRRLISKSKGPADSDHTWMLNVHNQVLRYRQRAIAQAGVKTAVVLADHSLSKDTWYHGAGTYDGHLARLYQDGALVKSDSLDGPIAQENLPIHLGNNPGYANQHFFGLIDEVRISRVSRSATWLLATSEGLHGKLCTFGAVEECPKVEPKVDPAKVHRDAAEMLTRGRARERAGEWLEAMALYEGCAELDTPSAAAARAEVYRVLREPAYAAAHAKDRRVNGASRLLATATALRKADRAQDAAEALDELLLEFPASPQVEAARKLLADLRPGGGK